jgi:nicotinate-nucleotide adenylyltransferase
MTRAGRVGILGGTFNPIHLGHLRAAEEVCEALGLERMILVPSAQPPHKEGSADDPIAPASDRLAWTRLATDGNPRFEVDSIEIDRGGRSYSVDTVREISGRASHRPVFAIGCDAFAELASWREPKALLELAHFAVMTRPPVLSGSLEDWLPEGVRDEIELEGDGLRGRHHSAGTWIRVLGVSALDISSSDIRRRLRNGRSVRYLLPERVREAVERSGAYAGAAATEDR